MVATAFYPPVEEVCSSTATYVTTWWLRSVCGAELREQTMPLCNDPASLTPPVLNSTELNPLNSTELNALHTELKFTEQPVQHH